MKLQLRKMHSLLHNSDPGLKPYHLSLLDFVQDKKRAGKYCVVSWLTAALAWKVLRMPRVKLVAAGINVTLFGPLIILLINPRWFTTVGVPISYTLVGATLAILAISMDSVFWMAHRQKVVLIRGLLAKSVV